MHYSIKLGVPLRILVVPLFLLFLPSAYADWALNMPVGVTEISRNVYGLHMTIFWICVAIAVIVFGVMFWSILHHRKSRGAIPAQFHESTLVEIIWTLIPLLILIAMAVPATATLIKMYDASDAEVDVQITGYQWKWRYQYLNEDVDFFSNLNTPQEQIQNEAPKGEHYLLEVDEPLVLPVGKKVRFLITANDVIHSWWVPDLAVKKDAIPGFINEAWVKIEEPGIYRGQCAELCGKDHGFMPVVVVAKSEKDYQEWLVEKQAEKAALANSANREWSLEELMERGEKVYAASCAACHQPNGMGIPPAFPALNGNTIVTQDIDKHIDVVLKGVTGTAMQAFAAQLNDVDLAAVITYERNAWDNKTGDVVSPQMIKEKR
ncbi:cytochrome c oxidase subunit II [Balneatrix alpica]|uniref:Cytochrome c oxidase subunit 2 n=1 Tax=Balneatrix alpica TaxID=75684 RepID=A0ABV5Z6A2_9GAMM|nr:cytochrome c oxidase subunit II [Balneatrix alpica]